LSAIVFHLLIECQKDQKIPLIFINLAVLKNGFLFDVSGLTNKNRPEK
jgi:hypothetical protein